MDKLTRHQEDRIREIFDRQGFKTLEVSFENEKLEIKVEPLFWEAIIKIAKAQIAKQLQVTDNIDIDINL